MPVLFAPIGHEVEWFVGLNLMKSRAAAKTDPVRQIPTISPIWRIDNRRCVERLLTESSAEEHVSR